MKQIKPISILILLLTLISASPTAAQDINPPETFLNEPPTLSSVLDTESSNDFEHSSSSLITKKENLSQAADQSADRKVQPSSGIIDISTLPNVNEKSPDIAHGGDYYMVVYDLEFTTEDRIIAQVLTNDGHWVDSIVVQTCSKNRCEYPAVAFEAKSGLFVVAYAYLFSGSDWEIYAKAVSPTDGVLGDGFTMVTTSTNDEQYPSIACNHDDGSCLVAFQTNSSNSADSPIQGRFLKPSVDGLNIESIVRNLTDASIGLEPRLAWGKGTGTYMVTYRSEDGGNFSASYTHVHDKPAISGTQYLHGNASVVNFGDGHNISNNDVAFDPCTQHYVVTFGHDYDGGGGDYDIYAIAKHATSVFGQAPFSIVKDPHYTNHSRISFVTDDNLASTCGSMDRLVFTYWNEALGIMAGELRGNNNAITPVYETDSVFDHLLIHPHLPGQNKRVSSQEISSSSILGELFIVFEYYDTNIPYEFNVKGQIITIMEKNFLPLIIK